MSIIRGDSELYDLTFYDRQGEPFPLSSCIVVVTCKASHDLPDSDALYQHHIEIDGTGAVVSQNGIYLVNDDASNGLLLERISPEESAAFEEGDYIFDVQIRFPSADVPGESDIETPINGDEESVELDVTRETGVPS